MVEFISQPWHWAVAGVLIGLTVPTLLIIGNKAFGLSSNLRHICAACFPAGLDFFKYDWKKEIWNLFFAAGIIIGGYIGSFLITNPDAIIIQNSTVIDLKNLGVQEFRGIMPADIFGLDQIFTLKGFIFLVLGGFMVGFGTRYGNGCTSGHAIMGLSNLQWPSLVAVICFMGAGVFMTHFGFPIIFNLIK